MQAPERHFNLFLWSIHRLNRYLICNFDWWTDLIGEAWVNFSTVARKKVQVILVALNKGLFWACMFFKCQQQTTYSSRLLSMLRQSWNIISIHMSQQPQHTLPPDWSQPSSGARSESVKILLWLQLNLVESAQIPKVYCPWMYWSVGEEGIKKKLAPLSSQTTILYTSNNISLETMRQLLEEQKHALTE